MAHPGQPPLPPNSPPPDLVVPKKEVKNEEYTDTAAAAQKPEPKVEAEEVKNEKPAEKIMCRQFARQTCTRGSSCIYVHELILSQLPGVYTFCKNFQNSLCKFPMCKFVHATVFQKEHFYKTGYLPPQTLVHLKESNSALAPLSTPTEAPPAETIEFMNPPPNMHPGVYGMPMSGTSPPDVYGMPMSGTSPPDVYGMPMSGTSPPNVYGMPMSGTSPPDVFPLSEMHGPSPGSFPQDIPQHEFETSVKSKVCKTCDINTCRFLLAKNLYEEQLVIKESLCQQKIKHDRIDNNLNNMLIKYLLDNDMLLIGGGQSISQLDMDAVLADLIMKELEGRKFYNEG